MLSKMTLLPFLLEPQTRNLKENMPCHRPVSLLRQSLGWVLSLLLTLLVQATALAQDRILEKSYWTDTTGTASFEQARMASYTPYTGVLSKGFSNNVQWVRLKIDGVPAQEASTLVLRIRPVYLDSISLFDPAQSTLSSPLRVTGDLTPWRSNEFESLHHTFQIPALTAPREVWLRLTTNSTQLLHVEALTPRDMLHEEHGLWLLYSAMLALILTFLTWVFLAWLGDRDPVNGIFVLRQIVLLLYTASYLGYHRILMAGVLEPPAQDFFYNTLVVLTTALSVFFEYRFLREYVMPMWGRWLFRALLLVSGVAMSLLIMGVTRQALSLNMLLNALGLVSILVVACRVRLPKPDQAQADSYQLPKSAVVSYYLLIIAVLALSILPSLGLLQGTMLSIYGVLLYGLISGLFMTTLLIVRSRQIESLRIAVANSLFLSREQLAIEQKRRQDQTQLLSMLMHELKTPLAVIDMAVSTRSPDARTSDYVNRAVNNIKGILDRCIQTDRMVEREFKLQSQTLDLSSQLQQWLQDRHDKHERITSSIVPGLVLCSDLQCLQIIANNLIDNAFKHGDAQAQVQVSLSAQPGDDGRPGLLLSVSNCPGPSGWPDADKLFVKYYRSTSAQRQSGTGLGLYLSHKLAAQLGGELRYQHDAQHIRFELWLPT
jgi:signal transduction histidine kinase